MSGLGGFESEFDIEERRKKRQEEWEKVRTADQPEGKSNKFSKQDSSNLYNLFSDAPEEVYDPRSLYDRLKEQKDAKQEEFEESRKFKNMIRGLDDEDVDHLHEVDVRKVEEERKVQAEEMKELNEYRQKVAELQEKSADQVVTSNHLISFNIIKIFPETFSTRAVKVKAKGFTI